VLQNVTLENNVAVGRHGSYNWFLSPALPAAGGGVYSSGALTITGCVIRGNQAIGGDGAWGTQIPRSDPGNTGGGWTAASAGDDGLGGGIFIAGGTASISSSTFSSNIAQGGAGGSSPQGTPPNGGDGFGGGVYIAGGNLSLRNVTITSNRAQGGAAGFGVSAKSGKRQQGQPGLGLGGGLYVNTAASAGLDAFTKSHITQNTASSSNKADIFGSYTTIV
jgi:hypothetical protein